MIDPSERLAKSFLLTSFEEFFADLLRVKRAVVNDPWGIGARDASEDDRTEMRLTAAHSVRQRLKTLLEKQSSEAMRQGEQGAAIYREAQYVMAALADEVLLHLDWEGRSAWAGQLLETELFGTQVAGERIFQRIEKFLLERDATRREIEVVYLLALSLGFEGKYRGGDLRELKRLRRGLYDLVLPREPSVVTGERRLFPQSYIHTLDRSAPIRLPTVGRWAAALALVLAIYLAAAHVAWMDVTNDIRQVNATIAEMSR